MKSYKIKRIQAAKARVPFWKPWGFWKWLVMLLLFVVLLLLFIILFCLPYQRPIVLGQGDVQVTLRWNTNDDIDLHVTDPRGEVIYFDHKKSLSGGKLDVDANASSDHCMINPVENIFWPEGRAPFGKYAVKVVYFNKRQSAPVSYTVVVKYGEQEKFFEGSLNVEKQEQMVCDFEYIASE